MITRIREVRKAKGLTLEQVGALCDPPTTAQTIGRLETLLQRYVYARPLELKREPGLRAAVLALLDALVECGSDGAHLRTAHRCRPQQSFAVGGQQALGVVEVDRGLGRVHVTASGWPTWR